MRTTTAPRWQDMLRPSRLPQLVWLTVVWVLLWGSVSVATVLGGLLVAVLVTVAFPMPAMPGHLSVRPLRLARLVAYRMADLLASSSKVSWQALRHGPRATAGIVEVPLLTDSERIIVVVANAVSLAPGEFVLQIDCERDVCYVYGLGIRNAADAERVRAQVLELQRRVVAAVPTSPGGAS